MNLTVNTDTQTLSVDSAPPVRGAAYAVFLKFVSKGVPVRQPSGVAIYVSLKSWANPAGTLLASVSPTRPNADMSPYTGTLSLNGAALLALFTTGVTSYPCSIEVKWETSAGSGAYYKTQRKQMIVEADTMRDTDSGPAIVVANNDFYVTNGTSLLANVAAGKVNGSTISAQSGIALTNNATNYLQINSSGVASANTSGFTSGYAPLATLTTSGGTITVNADLRGWVEFKDAGGTVTSVGLSLPNIFTVSNSPVTGTGTLTAVLATQTANIVFAGPASGGAATPTFRALVAADLTGLIGITVDSTAVSGGTIGRVFYHKTGNVVGELTIASANTASAIVTRDGSGNFAAGTITANLTGNADTATLAATSTIANEASDTTCFPLFATAATGSLALKSNAGFTFDSSTRSLTISNDAAVLTVANSAQTEGIQILPNVINYQPPAGSQTILAFTAAGGTITFPGVTGTVITTGDTSTVTNTMLAGSIANAKLANSTITIAGTSVALGGSTSSLPSPGAIGGTTPAAGTFTTLVAGSTTSLLLGTAGSAVGNIGFRNATSGTATLAPPTGALGTYTVTLPNAASVLPILSQQITFTGATAARTKTWSDASDTLAELGQANVFTAQQTIGTTNTVKFGATANATIGVAADATSSNLNIIAPQGAGTITLATANNATSLTVSGGATPTLQVAGTGLLKFGATALAAINVSADTTAGVLTLASPSSGTTAFNTAGAQSLVLSGGAAVVMTGGAGNMKIVAGTGASRTLTFQTTTSGSTATDAITINNVQQVSFAASTAATTSGTGGAVFAGGIGVQGNIYGGRDVIAATARYIYWATSTALDATQGNGLLSVTTQDNSKGVVMNCSVANGTVTFRNLTNAADATVNVGVFTASGTATFSAAVVGTPQALSGAGAINVTTLSTDFTSTGAANALTLADGSATGQLKIITHIVKGALGTGVLTPTTANGFTTITFTNAGEATILKWSTGGWICLSLNGAVKA